MLLDSNHSKDHVLAELEAYAPLVSEGLYRRLRWNHARSCWGPRTQPDWSWNNPISAVNEFLSSHPG